MCGAQKGGCGKSTLAVNICAQLTGYIPPANHAALDVMLVDADRQSTAANWANDRLANPALARVHCVQKYDNIRDTLLDLNRRYDYVIVDAAGRDSRELRTGMTAADILIIPFRPSQPDLDTLPVMQDIITGARDLNPALQVFALLTMAPTNPAVHEEADARAVLADYPEIKLLATVIRDRKVYRDAMSDGKGVLEMANAKAHLEMNQLMLEIL